MMVNFQENYCYGKRNGLAMSAVVMSKCVQVELLMYTDTHTQKQREVTCTFIFLPQKQVNLIVGLEKNLSKQQQRNASFAIA